MLKGHTWEKHRPGPMHYLSFGEPGTKRCLYKTEAAGRKDWTVYRATLLAEFGRRPWAFWIFDMEMDRPLSVSDGHVIIRDLGLARNAEESTKIDAEAASQFQTQRLSRGGAEGATFRA